VVLPLATYRLELVDGGGARFSPAFTMVAFSSRPSDSNERTYGKLML
jgi:hypothetical protein